MSEQPKKRPWLQFHLSTAVVLMFVAAGLLWANLTGRRLNPSLETAHNSAQAYGLPFEAVFRIDMDWQDRFELRSASFTDVEYGGPTGHIIIFPVWCFLDIICALVIVFVVAFVCERRIRRRERQP
jgi:hypothetical protein